MTEKHSASDGGVTPLDLEPIRQSVAIWSLAYNAKFACDQIDRLLAEVDRLRSALAAREDRDHNEVDVNHE